MAIGQGTNLFAPVTSTLSVSLTDENGLAMMAKCTGTPPTTANTFQHGCIINRTDSGTGVIALFQNTGSAAVPVWTAIDTALPGDTASSLIDTNSVTALDVGTTASAVNNLRVTNSATGAVTANAVQLSAVGTDAAVSIKIVPKGVTGITTIGLPTGTGDIVIGSSSGAQAVKLGDGAGVATVNLAHTGVAGNSVNIAGAAVSAATDTVNIATGNAVTSGGKVVHIADGVPGAGTTNAITIGSGGTTTGTSAVTIGSVGAAAHTTVINGGNGTGVNAAIKVAPQAAGDILIGAAAQTGDVIVGQSSGTQAVKIGNGAGVSTVNISNASIVGANCNIATVATGAGITDTVAISTGNAAATGIKVVNILTGTAGTNGNNRLTMGGGAPNAKVTVNAIAVVYGAWNFIPVETGGNDAIAGALTDASGSNVTLGLGLRLSIKIAHTLAAGAITFNLNGGGAVVIKSHNNPANNIGTAYASGAIVDLMYDGTQWLDLSQ